MPTKKKATKKQEPPPAMLRLTVREFRAKMGEHLGRPNPIRLGSHFATTALVIPIPQGEDRWQDSKKELREARRAALAAFKELEEYARD